MEINVLAIGTWHNLVFTINGSNFASLYVDGILQDSGGLRNAENPLSQQFYIGSSGDNYANMEMSKMHLFYSNRALSASEVPKTTTHSKTDSEHNGNNLPYQTNSNRWASILCRSS